MHLYEWRYVRSESAFSLQFSHLEGAPQLKEGVAAKQGSDEDAVFLEDSLDLLEESGQIVDPVGAKAAGH